MWQASLQAKLIDRIHGSHQKLLFLRTSEYSSEIWNVFFYGPKRKWIMWCQNCDCDGAQLCWNPNSTEIVNLMEFLRNFMWSSGGTGAKQRRIFCALLLFSFNFSTCWNQKCEFCGVVNFWFATWLLYQSRKNSTHSKH